MYNIRLTRRTNPLKTSFQQSISNSDLQHMFIQHVIVLGINKMI